MRKDALIAVTGALGFIGSALAGWLNQLGYENLLLIDDFSRKEKYSNLDGKRFQEKVERSALSEWWDENPNRITYFFHLGARTDTTETDYELLKRLNLEYSQQVWHFCCRENIPLVYASSAATYGNGEFGYKDEESDRKSVV